MLPQYNQQRIADVLTDSAQLKTQVAQECGSDILIAGAMLATAAQNNVIIMLCGNGGSAADAQHIAAELVVRLRSGIERRAIKAMALTTDSSVLTAGGNDYGYNNVFARQVEAFAEKQGVLIAITTSGTSANVLEAVLAAKQHGMKVIGLLGGSGGSIKPLCDAAVVIPSTVTARIQECHITIGHIWCEIIEETLFPDLFRK